MYSDPYLLWTIAAHGTPVASAMPVFKDILTDDKIWKVIAFMHSRFPTPATLE